MQSYFKYTLIFFNDNITINSKHVFLPFLYNNGITFIKYIIFINGNFRELKSIEDITGKKVNFLIYYGLRNA